MLWAPSFHFPPPSSIARALETIFCLHPHPPALQANPTLTSQSYCPDFTCTGSLPAPPFPVGTPFQLPGPSLAPAGLQAPQHRGHALEQMAPQLSCAVWLSPAFSHSSASHLPPQTPPGPATPGHVGTNQEHVASPPAPSSPQGRPSPALTFRNPLCGGPPSFWPHRLLAHGSSHSEGET